MQSLVTHYGERYNGRILGCGNGYYSSDDPTIVAVSPERYQQMPCGTRLQICGAGGCIIATRQDACPGCSANLYDLSESGFAAVCGMPRGVCSATVSIVQTCSSMDLGWQDRPAKWGSNRASNFAKALTEKQASQPSTVECAVR